LFILLFWQKQQYYKKGLPIHNLMNEEKNKGDDCNSAFKGELGRKNALGCLILILFFGTILFIIHIVNSDIDF
jgi:hypothetical protein